MGANREKAKIPFYWKKKTVWHELFDGHYIICKFLSFARRNTRAGLGKVNNKYSIYYIISAIPQTASDDDPNASTYYDPIDRK